MSHRILAALIWLFIWPAISSAELTAQQLLLVVNRNAPEGVELATYYARARNVPPAQIIQLDLPTGNEISIDDYERKVADPLRAALRAAPYANDIKCVVTFLGVPYRIPPRAKDGDATIAAELKLIESHLSHVRPKLTAMATEAERLAQQTDPRYAATQQDPVIRIRQAATHTQPLLVRLPDGPERKSLEQNWAQLLAAVQKPVELSEADGELSTTQKAEIAETMRSGALRSYDSAARRLLRADSRRLGFMVYSQILEAQKDYLGNDQTDAALDSELACLKWAMYRRTRWQGNPLRFNAEDFAAAPAMLMTARIDGPGGAAALKKRIDEGLAIEKTGLRGNIVLDSRNIPLKKPDGQIDGYGIYDESIRKLKKLLADASCTLPVIFDDSDKLIADDSLTDIAVYCGWYDPDKVHLPGKFVPGSVGFHIASYTAIDIRGWGGGLWTPWMIHAGVAHTLGAVSEPYLHAFPAADEFFPLLLTGRLTMAEIYWRSAPMTSWKIVVLGDPLYNPFRAAPALKVDVLPPAFRTVLEAMGE